MKISIFELPNKSEYFLLRLAATLYPEKIINCKIFERFCNLWWETDLNKWLHGALCFKVFCKILNMNKLKFGSYPISVQRSLFSRIIGQEHGRRKMLTKVLAFNNYAVLVCSVLVVSLCWNTTFCVSKYWVNQALQTLIFYSILDPPWVREYNQAENLMKNWPTAVINSQFHP